MDSARTHPPPTSEATVLPARKGASRSIWSGVLFGIGLIAFLDETVFHQILHWHHFYDLATTDIGLVSDGFFHAVSWVATIAGLFLFADLRRRRSLVTPAWWGGVLVGAGGFQLYDGTVQHKLLGIHQIRYVPELAVYDAVWLSVAVLMIIIGVVFIVRALRAVRAG
jgi:uncharacterized membrane protein